MVLIMIKYGLTYFLEFALAVLVAGVTLFGVLQLSKARDESFERNQLEVKSIRN